MRTLKILRSITNRDSSSLTRYLAEINQVEVLTAEEEIALLKRIRKGDTTALEHLTKANLRFVVSVAKKYQHAGMSLADLISEGNLGLIKAAERFDETRGFKFISYAIWWIRRSIMKALSEHSRIIRLPQNKLGSLNKIKNAFTKLEQEYEREPSYEEIAHVLDVKTDQILYLLGLENKQLSMDAPLSLDGDSSLLDIIENPDAESADFAVVHKESLQQEIKKSLSHLTDKQAEVIKLYFGMEGHEPLNMHEISKKMKVSSERVRQLKMAALSRLRKNTRSKILRDYFGKA